MSKEITRRQLLRYVVEFSKGVGAMEAMLPLVAFPKMAEALGAVPERDRRYKEPIPLPAEMGKQTVSVAEINQGETLFAGFNFGQGDFTPITIMAARMNFMGKFTPPETIGTISDGSDGLPDVVLPIANRQVALLNHRGGANEADRLYVFENTDAGWGSRDISVGKCSSHLTAIGDNLVIHKQTGEIQARPISTLAGGSLITWLDNGLLLLSLHPSFPNGLAWTYFDTASQKYFMQTRKDIDSPSIQTFDVSEIVNYGRPADKKGLTFLGDQERYPVAVFRYGNGSPTLYNTEVYAFSPDNNGSWIYNQMVFEGLNLDVRGFYRLKNRNFGVVTIAKLSEVSDYSIALYEFNNEGKCSITTVVDHISASGSSYISCYVTSREGELPTIIFRNGESDTNKVIIPKPAEIFIPLAGKNIN